MFYDNFYTNEIISQVRQQVRSEIDLCRRHAQSFSKHDCLWTGDIILFV